MLLGQDSPDEPDDAAAVREDPDDVGAPADLAVEAFAGVVAPDLPPELLFEDFLAADFLVDFAIFNGFLMRVNKFSF